MYNQLGSFSTSGKGEGGIAEWLALQTTVQNGLGLLPNSSNAIAMTEFVSMSVFQSVIDCNLDTSRCI